MNSTIGVHAFIIISAFLRFFFTPAAFAQVIRVETSYSALSANMAAYWLTEETKSFENTRFERRRRAHRKRRYYSPSACRGRNSNRDGGRHRRRGRNLAGSDIVSIASIESRMPYALFTQKETRTIEQFKEQTIRSFPFRQRFRFSCTTDSSALRLVPDKDVTIFPTGRTSTRLSAFSKRSVDSTVLTPEFFQVAKNAGFTILVDPTPFDIPFPQLEVLTTRNLSSLNPTSSPGICTQSSKGSIS